MSTNEGIQIHGGSFDVDGALAVGRRASAKNVVHAAAPTLDAQGREEIAQRLAELAEALERDRTQLADADAAVEQLEATAQELEAPEPDPSRVRSLLNGLKSAVGSAAEVAASVVALEQAAGVLL